MITRQFRLHVQARELLSQGHPPAEIGSRLGLTSPFALNKTLEKPVLGGMQQAEVVSLLTLAVTLPFLAYLTWKEYRRPTASPQKKS